MKLKTFLTSISLFCVFAGYSQGTLEDYNRAYSLAKLYNYGRVENANINPHWIEGTDKLWYIYEKEGVKTYTLLDGKTLKTSPLFNSKKLAAALGKFLNKDINANNLTLEGLRVSSDGKIIGFNYAGNQWEYEIKTDNLQDLGKVPLPPVEPHWMVVDEEKSDASVISPDGMRSAFIRDNNVWSKDLTNAQERQITYNGTIGNYYSSEIKWSPDSKKISLNKIRPVEKRYVYYVESSPASGSQPVLHKQEYAKPGDELRQKTPHIINIETGEILEPSNELFSNQYDLYGPEWSDDSKAVLFEYNERGHKNYRLLEMSASNGEVRPVIEETHDKYINYSRLFRHMLDDGQRIIWSSERDNYNHLYLYDRKTGSVINQITQGPWYVRDVVHVDEPNEKIYFSANGMNPEEDPYYIRFYSINFDGSDLKDLTPAPGTHRALFSSDYKYLTDTYSTISQPPVTVLRDTQTGKELMKLAEGNIDELVAAGWSAPEMFVAPGRDGTTPMYGVIYRPSNFSPDKKYPVIEYIYQGPGDQYVPKAFYPYHRYIMPLTELGFIVVMVDGMGTSFRTREFENICYKNLADAGLPDHIAWIKHAGDKYPYMDLERIGIFGASAGGQESLNALLTYPEFYKAAYSACGCHDNRMDKIWWNEQWLGYPIDDSYIKASNVENAHLLERPLMLVVGELDDNVDPASTMQVADALIKANKDFELVVLPGVSHTLGEEFGDHKRYDFFVRNLLGVEPPKWNEITYP